MFSIPFLSLSSGIDVLSGSVALIIMTNRPTASTDASVVHAGAGKGALCQHKYSVQPPYMSHAATPDDGDRDILQNASYQCHLHVPVN